MPRHTCLAPPAQLQRTAKLAADAAIILSVLPESVRSLEEWEATVHDPIADASVTDWELRAARAVLTHLAHSHPFDAAGVQECCARTAAARLQTSMQSWSPPRGVPDMVINATDTVIGCIATDAVVRLKTLFTGRPMTTGTRLSEAPSLYTAKRSRPILAGAASSS